MVRPRVARRFRRTSGERSCINVSGLWLEHLLRAIMDISARAFSLADRPRLGHLGHQGSHALGRPNLHLVSSSRRPRLEIGYIIVCSSCRAVPLFEQWPFLRPGPQRAEHGARIKQVGRLHRRSSSVRRRAPWPAPPRRCGQVCWRARSPARCGATASWRLRSRI
jgi:hypothetical protein